MPDLFPFSRFCWGSEMSDFKENPLERAAFDRETAAMFDGNPLLHVAATLSIWQKVAPHGSYAQLLAIMANEVAKAAISFPPHSDR